jgi:hypothetical protein
MSALSAFLENRIADHLLGNVPYTAPGAVHLALFTVAPTESGGGTEVSGGSYGRVAINNNATNWPAATGGLKSNGTAITFPTATGTWGTVTHWALFDAASGGNMLFFGTVSPSKLIESGDQFSVAIGELDLTFE